MSTHPTCWPARLTLGFSAQESGRSVLSAREHEGPILVQRALYPEGPQVCHVTVLHPPSGIAGGDTIDIDIDVQAGAHAALTTPGATRWYKSNGRPARQTVRLAVAAGARLEWLPMENLFFEETDALSRTEIDLHSGAVAIGWDIFQLGSITRPTHWETGRARAELSLKVDGRLVWVEQGTIGAASALRSAVTGLAGLPVLANVWSFGPALGAARKEALSAVLPWQHNIRAGVTEIPLADGQALTLVRCIGLHAEDVRRLWVDVWQHLRPALLKLPGIPLRLWST
jgi:urease accessory protein